MIQIKKTSAPAAEEVTMIDFTKRPSEIIAQAKQMNPGFFYRYADGLLYVYTKRRRLYKVYDKTMDEELCRITMAIIGVRYAPCI